MTEAAPKVFISYSHDSPGHRDRVLNLANRLRADGVDAIVDHYVQFPPAGWPTWCDAEIRRADFVLMVCTETYLRRVNGEEEEGKGTGVLWEARLIRQHLYDAGADNFKFVPILLADRSSSHVPGLVKGATIYSVETPEGYEALLRLLTDQPLTPMPPLGPRRSLPAKERIRAGTDQNPSDSIASLSPHRPLSVSPDRGRGVSPKFNDRGWLDRRAEELEKDNERQRSEIDWRYWLLT
jgi:SEFIR domain